jgi:hypothetical protein
MAWEEVGINSEIGPSLDHLRGLALLKHVSFIMSPNYNLIRLVLFLSLAGVSSARGRLRESYQHFFPDLEVELTKIITQNCSALFQSYRQEQTLLYGTYCVKLYSCIIPNVSEYTKSNMATSGVLLGLSPWILSTIGSSTIEMSLLSSRRPVLAALLVLGSPAMNPTKPFQEYNPIKKLLMQKGEQWSPGQSNGRKSTVYIVLEFIAALLSIANLATLSWTLGWNTISTMSCDDSDTLVELWIGLAIIAHILGIVTFFRRARIHVDRDEDTSRSRLGRMARKARDWLGLIREFKLCVNQGALNVTWDQESGSFAFWSWIAALYTIAHLIFGTLVLSSLSFIGKCPRDQNIPNASEHCLDRQYRHPRRNPNCFSVCCFGNCVPVYRSV